eukprot:scaffold2165_cov294-Pinguiococcus_pyrenoidosus.AAC.7
MANNVPVGTARQRLAPECQHAGTTWLRATLSRPTKRRRYGPSQALRRDQRIPSAPARGRSVGCRPRLSLRGTGPERQG